MKIDGLLHTLVLFDLFQQMHVKRAILIAKMESVSKMTWPVTERTTVAMVKTNLETDVLMIVSVLFIPLRLDHM